MNDSNPILDAALEHEYPPFSQETGLDKIVAFGDSSHKCPVYVDRLPPCSNACPAGEDIRGFHNILLGVEEKGAQDRWEAAFFRLTDKNPFPFVMGQVCPAPCQDSCNRQYVDETVGINAVEHAIGKYGIENKLVFSKHNESTGNKVAIVGSGPAGLSCAYQLARRGHTVTLFESNEKLGGMMRYGTLGYRVSREELDVEIMRIVDMGIDVKTNVRIGVDITLKRLRELYDAVFLGVGAQNGRPLLAPGCDGTPYVTDTIAFLKAYETNGDVTMGERVVVIGDGDVAMDAARLAMRLGSQATILSGVPREEMNCSGFEFDEAAREGVEVDFLVSVAEVLRDGQNVTGLKCVRMIKKEKGEEGYNSPVPFFRYKPEPGSDFEIEADMVVSAIGQNVDATGLEETMNGGPGITVDRNLRVQEGVFAGGDAVKIAMFTTAIGHGRIAAKSIDRYLHGEPPPKQDRIDVITFEKLKSDYFSPAPRHTRNHNSVDRVEGNFDTLLETLSEKETVKESERCMSCGLCFECDQCMVFCPQECIVRFRNNPPGEVMFTHYEGCVGCHICAEICPAGYIDMGMGE